MIPWLSLALAGPADIPVDEAVQDAVDGLAAMGMTRADLTFGKDYVNGWGVRHDVWRLPGTEALLHDPIRVPADAAELAEALRTDDPRGLLLALGPPREPDRLVGVLAFHDAPECDLALKRPLREALCQVLGSTVFQPEFTARLQQVPDAVIDRILELEDPAAEAELPFTEYARIAAARLTAARGIDPVELLEDGAAVAGLAADLEQALAEVPARAWPRTPTEIRHGDLRIVIGTVGSESMRIDEAVLVVDPGGDDVWVGTPAPVSVLVDLGGDDTWNGAGAVVRGHTAVIDVEGDDTWTGGSPGPAGAIFGTAVVVDRAGTDTYEGRSWTQGAAEHGWAVLADLDGNDRYVAGIRGQGYGGVQGAGGLVDRGGHDVYRVGGLYAGVPHYPRRTHGMGQGMSMGMRPLAAAGLGVLHDVEGDDHYTGDLFSQGVSYWLGRGYLVDSRGDDVYSAHQYAQGVGVHLGVGALLDGEGDDRYAMRGLGLGSAHDYAVGWLVEGGGDDFFVHEDNSGVLGVGITNGVGFAIDRGGDDWQPLKDDPRGSFTRGHWGASALVDGGGSDVRHPFRSVEGAVLRVSPASVLVDLDEPLPFSVEAEAPPPLEPPEATEPFLHPDLGELGERVDRWCADGFGSAEDWIAALPALARDHLGDGYCLSDALGAFAEEPAVRAAIAAASEPSDRLSGRWLPRWLARLGMDDTTLPALERLASSPHPMVRKEVPLALAQLERDAEWLDGLARDPDVTVRAAAVHALDRLDASPERVQPHLNDPFAAVRLNAVEALRSHSDRDAAGRAVVAAWEGARREARWTLVYAAAELGVLDALPPVDDPVLDWHLERARR